MATPPVSGLPSPQSYDQLLSDMLSTYATKANITDFNVGSAVTSFFETVALTTARASGDIFQILKDFSIDRATGDALKNLAIENRVKPITAKPATGSVTVVDSSFSKISTKIYAGAMSPNIGSTSIKVSDASLFTSTGSIYLGRGTPNVEGPLPYTSIAPSGGFFIISLSSPTTKFHNVGESVILAQGGVRTIPVNSIVVSPALGSNTDIQFSVTSSAVILDGETTVSNVQVSALSPGSSGNVPAGAIKKFTSPPFANATVTNPLPFTTGKDNETDDALRVRIKRAIASTGLGTATAVESAVIGASPSDENVTVVSDNIVITSTGAILYIDDGSGYEAKSQGVGLESIVDSALGGEQFFQLATGGRQAPVAKAFLQSTFASTFDLIGGDTLAVKVGEITYQHVFADSDFISPGGATAFEVTASINADTVLGFEATTAGGGQFVVIRSKHEGNDSIQTATPTTDGRDAAVQLGFSSNKIDTLRLYKNRIPLSKDGAQAIIFSQQQAFWSSGITNGDTLTVAVDGTAPITYTITDADFVATGLFTTVSNTNSLESWRQVFISKLTGITTTIIGQQLAFASNLGDDNRAQVVIDPTSTLVTKSMFNTLELSSQGKVSDFTLDRNTAQFELVVPLVEGDLLSAGNDQTEARIEGSPIAGASVVFASPAHIWILVDNPGMIVPTGVVSNSNLIVSKPATNTVRYTSNANAFINVLPGDYLVIWSEELASSNRLEGRVHAVSSSTLDIVVTAAEYAAATPQTVVYNDGFVVARTTLAPQKFQITAGTKSLDQIAAELQLQSNQLIFSVQLESFLVVRTLTRNSSGSLLIVTADNQGKQVSFPVAGSNDSTESLIAFYDSATKDAQLPLFIHSSFAAAAIADPPNSYITSFTSALTFAGRDPNELISMLHPYGSIADTQFYGEDATTQVTVTQNGLISTYTSTGGTPFNLSSFIVGYFVSIGSMFNVANRGVWQIVSVTTTSFSVRNPLGVAEGPITLGSGFATQIFIFGAIKDEQPYGEYVQVTSITGTAVGIRNPATMEPENQSILRRFRIADRFYIANPLDFGFNDTMVVILDNNPSLESFEIPLYRRGITNTTQANNPSNFNAYDVDSGSTANFFTAFVNFDFSNFKVLMKAKKVLKQQAAQTAILYRATRWGRSGEKITVSYIDPSVENSAIGSNISVGETIDITISRKSGASVPTSIDSTTEWNVTITPNTPVAGVDQVTYTWNTVGTAPALTLVGGEYVNISDQTEFSTANTGVFRVSTQGGFTPTATSFSVQRPTGVAIAEANKATNVNGAIKFYQAVATMAADVATYVNANLVDITATLVNDGGTSGSGVLTFSTYEDSNFTTPDIQLLDGINWLASSNLSGSPQFTFKVPLAYSGAGPANAWYAFNNGEEVRIIPTTQDQVKRLISILAVSGFTTTGTVSLSERSSRLELATRVLGSGGAIQIAGGYGNGYEVPILDSGSRFDDNLMKVSVDRVASAGVHSDQWFRLQASVAQAKEDGFSSNTDVTISSFSVTESLISMANRLLTQRYFGKPRNFIRSQGDTFRIEKQGALICLSWTGVGSDPHFSKALVFNDTGGGTVNVYKIPSTNDAQYIIETGNANFTELSIGDELVVSGMPIAANNGTFLVTGVSSNGKIVQVFNPNAVNELSSGTFTFTGNSTSGDTFNINGTPLIAGTDFPIGGTSQITAANLATAIGAISGVVASSNGNIVTVTATTPSASVAMSYSGTAVITVSGSFLVGVTFVAGQFSATAAVSEGDTMVISSPFNILNQGNFRIIRRFNNSVWFENAQAVEEEVSLPANPISLGYSGTTTFTVDATNHLLHLQWGGAGTVPTLSNAKMGDIVTLGTDFNVNNRGSFMVIRSGNNFLEAINPKAVSESGILITSSLSDHRPQIQFSEYEATAVNDIFTITSDILGATNQGNWVIDQVIDQDHIVVKAILAAASAVNLTGSEGAVFVKEGTPYTGYKHVFLINSQPGAPTRNNIMFDTVAQYEKVDEAAGVQMVSLGKESFNTTIKNGLDSYRFNTGLIAEANRIVYGDPREGNDTYPGVGAAGADIFIQEPLTRRIKVAIVVRVNTGVPFSQIVTQVRSSVSSLINSNDIGQPIAIGNIIAAVSAIPGIRAESISFPQFDSSHDLIFLAPSEKARILDPTTDISVALVSQ